MVQRIVTDGYYGVTPSMIAYYAKNAFEVAFNIMVADHYHAYTGPNPYTYDEDYPLGVPIPHDISTNPYQYLSTFARLEGAGVPYWLNLETDLSANTIIMGNRDAANPWPIATYPTEHAAWDTAWDTERASYLSNPTAWNDDMFKTNLDYLAANNDYVGSMWEVSTKYSLDWMHTRYPAKKISYFAADYSGVGTHYGFKLTDTPLTWEYTPWYDQYPNHPWYMTAEWVFDRADEVIFEFYNTLGALAEITTIINDCIKQAETKPKYGAICIEGGGPFWGTNVFAEQLKCTASYINKLKGNVGPLDVQMPTAYSSYALYIPSLYPETIRQRCDRWTALNFHATNTRAVRSMDQRGVAPAFLGAGLCILSTPPYYDTFTNTGKEVLVLKNTQYNEDHTFNITIDGTLKEDNFDVTIPYMRCVHRGPFPLEEYGSQITVKYVSSHNLKMAILKRLTYAEQ